MLPAGIHFLLPCADRIAYVHSLKEALVLIVNSQAFTKDKVTVGVSDYWIFMVIPLAPHSPQL